VPRPRRSSTGPRRGVGRSSRPRLRDRGFETEATSLAINRDISYVNDDRPTKSGSMRVHIDECDTITTDSETIGLPIT
jgi:hypothetical protein